MKILKRVSIGHLQVSHFYKQLSMVDCIKFQNVEFWKEKRYLTLKICHWSVQVWHIFSVILWDTFLGFSEITHRKLPATHHIMQWMYVCWLLNNFGPQTSDWIKVPYVWWLLCHPRWPYWSKTLPRWTYSDCFLCIYLTPMGK